MCPFKMTGEVKILTSQEAFLAGHCPVTDRYFEPWGLGSDIRLAGTTCNEVLRITFLL